jgi:hypothetical protein
MVAAIGPMAVRARKIALLRNSFPARIFTRVARADFQKANHAVIAWPALSPLPRIFHTRPASSRRRLPMFHPSTLASPKTKGGGPGAVAFLTYDDGYRPERLRLQPSSLPSGGTRVSCGARSGFAGLSTLAPEWSVADACSVARSQTRRLFSSGPISFRCYFRDSF